MCHYPDRDGKKQRLRDPQFAEDAEPCLRLDVADAAPDVATALVNLPWEAMHDGTLFLAQRGVVVTRVIQRRSAPAPPPANRYLRILFLASSPEDVEPVLSYEEEERRILEAARSQPIGLVTEETGSLDGIQQTLSSFPGGAFDVLHTDGPWRHGYRGQRGAVLCGRERRRLRGGGDGGGF